MSGGTAGPPTTAGSRDYQNDGHLPLSLGSRFLIPVMTHKKAILF